MTTRYALYDTYSERCLLTEIQIFRHIYVLFRHIQAYCGISRALCNSYIFRILPYSESWHIQNPRYIQNSVKAYCGIFRTLCYIRMLRTLSSSDLCHIQNFGIFRTRGVFRILFIGHIQAYSDIFNNDSYNNTNFLFFTLILHTFQ